MVLILYSPTPQHSNIIRRASNSLLLIIIAIVIILSYIFQPAREARRLAQRAERRWGQLACFGAGCYIEMATSYHQPHEHELVGG